MTGSASRQARVLRQLALRAVPASGEATRRTRRSRRRPQETAEGETVTQTGRRRAPRRSLRQSHNFHLVVVAERTGAQRLRVGFWRHVRYGRVQAEGVIVGDVLSPVEKEAVGSWAASTRSAVSRPSTRDRFLQVHAERDFVEEILYRRAIRGRPYQSQATQREGLARGATIVCWDGAFVLSRFCLYASTAFSGLYRGGLSMALAGRPAPAGSGGRGRTRPGFLACWPVS